MGAVNKCDCLRYLGRILSRIRNLGGGGGGGATCKMGHHSVGVEDIVLVAVVCGFVTLYLPFCTVGRCWSKSFHTINNVHEQVDFLLL